MFPARPGPGMRHTAGINQSQSVPRDGADRHQRHLAEIDDLRNGLWIQREKQFVILPIRQRMEACRNPIFNGKRLGIRMNRQPRRMHRRAASLNSSRRNCGGMRSPTNASMTMASNRWRVDCRNAKPSPA